MTSRLISFSLALILVCGSLAAQPEKAHPMRLPVPEGAAVEEAEKLVRETFKSDYAKKKQSEQSALARKLVKAADEMKDNPPAKFVLYREAANAASRGGDLLTALESSVGMSQSFAVKHSELQLGVLESVESAKTVPGRAVAEAALEIAEEAFQGDEYDTALKVLKVGGRAAGRAGITSLGNTVSALVREVEATQKAFQSLEADRKTLAANSNDTAANRALGRFLCLRKGEWASGLPYLAKGGDGKISAAAEKELAAKQ